MTKASDDEPFGDEYAAVEFRLDGGLLSLAMFALQLAAPYIVRWQPWRPKKIWWMPMVVPSVIFVLAVLGLLFALWGRRRSKKATTVRFGLLLNGVVFVILLLWGLLMLIIFGAGRSTTYRPVQRSSLQHSTSYLVSDERLTAVAIDQTNAHHLVVIVQHQLEMPMGPLEEELGGRHRT